MDQSVSAVSHLAGGMTSTMLVVETEDGQRAVLRLMTEEPWRTHGPDLTRREADALVAVVGSGVPVPTSYAVTSRVPGTDVAAHLMSWCPGEPTTAWGSEPSEAMAACLESIHSVVADPPFREFQSWAWEAKWVVPGWSSTPDAWAAAFEVLAQEPPEFEPVFLHRDFGHRNLLWDGTRISGVVDWVETSTGPRWLDAGHAATNLAVAFGVEAGRDFLARYASRVNEPADRCWLVMDAVGFLPPPGGTPMFGSSTQLARLDAWLSVVLQGDALPS